MHILSYELWLQHTARSSAPLLPLLDLRSESEFARGHIPNASSLPLFNDQERHDVGLLYKTAGKAAATHLGVQLFGAKAETFLEQCYELAGSEQALGLYCWRGGMRSRSVALWLASLGFKISLLAGGYKQYRKFVSAHLAELAKQPLLVLNGRTGSGKTALLAELGAEGLPVLDFEGLACHRGSAFGGLGQHEQSPTQQNFENRLAECYLNLKRSSKKNRPILVELENHLGPLSLGIELRRALTRAPMVYLERNFEQRVALLEAVYAQQWGAHLEAQFLQQLEMLRRFLSKLDYEGIVAAAKTADIRTVIAQLLRLRYDPAYDKSLTRYKNQAVAHFNMSTQAPAAKNFLRHYLSATTHSFC